MLPLVRRVILLPAYAFLASTLKPQGGSLLFVHASEEVIYAPSQSPPQERFEKQKVVGELITESGFYQSLTVTDDSPIHISRSKYQKIEVHTSLHYGKVLVLDGVVQLTEHDADSYNEMMAHIPLFEHPSPKKVLVIGGGDGYVLSETLKHPSVVHVDHVDLDEDVIKVCREYFSWGKAWEDPRVTLYTQDGATFVRDAPDNTYDVIIQDSSDPFTFDEEGDKVDLPSKVLYSRDHFHHLNRILTNKGVLNLQSETFNIPSDIEGIAQWRRQALTVGFESAVYGSLYISSYPTGQIGFLLCKKLHGYGPTEVELIRRFDEMERNGMGTTYYQPKLQKSCFDLPLRVDRMIYSSETLSENDVSATEETANNDLSTDEL